jgi:hypothetical protein
MLAAVLMVPSEINWRKVNIVTSSTAVRVFADSQAPTQRQSDLEPLRESSASVG